MGVDARTGQKNNAVSLPVPVLKKERQAQEEQDTDQDHSNHARDALYAFRRPGRPAAGVRCNSV